MGKIIIQGNSGGGADPDEISARASDVLKGKTTIDSDGEVVEGEIERRGTGGENALKIGKNSDSIYVSFSAGYYENGNSNNALPYVKVPYSLLSQTLELNANKMLENYSVAGVSGSIPFRGRGLIDDKKASGNFNIVNNYADIDIQNIPEGYYKKDSSYSWSPAVRVPLQKLLDYLGIDTSKMLDTLTVGNRRGSIPVRGGGRIATKSYLWGESDTKKWFVSWMPSGYYHEMNNTDRRGFSEILTNMDDVYRVLNLRPDVIRAGHTVGFMTGTMPDYSSGRVVFNGATFDGVLVSGVADNQDKTLVTYNQSLYLKNISEQYYAYEYWGIRDGGLRFYAINRNGYRSISGYRGIVFDHSIDLSPFKKVKLVFHKWGSVRGTPNGFGRADLDLFLGKLSEIKRNNNIYNNCKSKNITNVITSETSRYYFDDWETVEVDIAEDVGQHYVGIGINANGVYAYDQSEMHVVITYIEFIN